MNGQHGLFFCKAHQQEAIKATIAQKIDNEFFKATIQDQAALEAPQE